MQERPEEEFHAQMEYIPEKEDDLQEQGPAKAWNAHEALQEEDDLQEEEKYSESGSMASSTAGLVNGALEDDHWPNSGADVEAIQGEGKRAYPTQNSYNVNVDNSNENVCQSVEISAGLSKNTVDEEWPSLDQANRQPAKITTKAKVDKVGKMGHSEGNVGQDPPRPQYRTQNERKRPERAQLTLGDYFESAKLQEGKRHPTKDRPSILMTLPKGMDNKGQTRWWEEVSLSMVHKGAPVIAFTNPPPECDLVPSINDSLLKKGIQVD